MDFGIQGVATFIHAPLKERIKLAIVWFPKVTTSNPIIPLADVSLLKKK